MAWPTLEALTQRVIQKLSQVPGTAVQTYSEDRIEQIIIDHYLLVARDPEYHWSQFVYRSGALTLDGSTGQITTDLTSISRGEDISAVYYGTDQTPMLTAPANTNPLTAVMVERVIEFDSTDRFFTIYPLTTTGTVYVVGKSIPDRDAIVASTQIKFDDTYLIHISAWDYLVSDGDNPGDAAKMQAIADVAMNRLKSKYNKKVIPLNGTTSAIPTTWENR